MKVWHHDKFSPKSSFYMSLWNILDYEISITFNAIFFFEPVGSDLSGAFVLLRESEIKLKGIVNEKFDLALKHADKNAIDR